MNRQLLDEDDLERLKAKINTLREIEHDPKNIVWLLG